MTDKAEQALKACKVAHTAWREHRSEFPKRTMELALALRALRLAHVSNKAFGRALDKDGDLRRLRPHERVALLGMAEHKAIATKVLGKTERWSVQHIWVREIKPILVEKGDIEPRKRAAAEPQPAGESVTMELDEIGLDPSDAIAAINRLGQTYSMPDDWAALLEALADPEHEVEEDWRTRDLLARVENVEALRELADMLDPTATDETRAAKAAKAAEEAEASRETANRDAAERAAREAAEVAAESVAA